MFHAYLTYKQVSIHLYPTNGHVVTPKSALGFVSNTAVSKLVTMKEVTKATVATAIAVSADS